MLKWLILFAVISLPLSAQWDIQKGVSQLVEGLQRLHLDENKFKQKDFYRLQQINHLYVTNQINGELFWNVK